MYSIFFKKRPIGTAEIIEEGLYYRFCCKYTTKLAGMNRIVVINRKKRIDLGICVPKENAFVVNTKIPRKHFVDNDFSFELISGSEAIIEDVYSGMVFEKLDKIETARFNIVNGHHQIIIE